MPMAAFMSLYPAGQDLRPAEGWPSNGWMVTWSGSTYARHLRFKKSRCVGSPTVPVCLGLRGVFWTSELSEHKRWQVWENEHLLSLTETRDLSRYKITRLLNSEVFNPFCYEIQLLVYGKEWPPLLSLCIVLGALEGFLAANLILKDYMGLVP